jgi:hypothetical protein
MSDGVETLYFISLECAANRTVANRAALTAKQMLSHEILDLWRDQHGGVCAPTAAA